MSSILRRYTLTFCLLCISLLPGRANSLLFDGIDDIARPNPDAEFGLTHFTVETWFNRANGGVAADIAGMTIYPIVTRGFAENYGLGVRTDGRLVGLMATGPSTWLTLVSNTVVPVGEWHHAALTNDGVTLKLYLDGLLVGQAPASLPPVTTGRGPSLGRTWNGNTVVGAWKGNLDETRIWSVARSAAEIQRDYTKSIIFLPGLLARWGYEGSFAGDGLSRRELDVRSGVMIVANPAPISAVSPIARISSPLTGTSFQVGGVVPLTIQYNLPARVDIYAGATKLGETTTDVFNLTGAPVGEYALYAVGVTADGTESTSAAPIICNLVPASGTNAVYFNGTSGTGATSSISGAALSTYTTEIWFRVEGDGQPVDLGNGMGAVTGLLHRGQLGNSTNSLLAFRPSDNRLVGGYAVAGLPTNGTFWIAGKTPVSRGVWHHAALTHDGFFVRLFLNGELEAEMRASATPNTVASVTTRVGALNQDPLTGKTIAGYFHGILDEARVWNYARARGALDGASRCGLPAGTSGLRSNWKMDEGGSSLQLADSGSQASAITLSGVSVRTQGAPVTGTLPPTATLVTPSGAQALAAGQPLNLTASATDNSAVVRVEYWDQTTKLGENTVAPYPVTWIPTLTGTYRIAAVAFDSDGNAAASVPVTVTVGGEGAAGAVAFNGGAARASAALPIAAPRFTIETWFRRDQAGVGYAYDGATLVEPLISRQYSSSDNQYVNFLLGVRASDGAVVGGLGYNSVNLVTGTTPSGFGEWRHAALTYDGVTARLYVNGQLEAAKDMLPGPSDPGMAITLGSHNNASLGIGFQGLLDEVRIWSYERKAVEIAGSRLLPIANQSGLVSRWTFAEGSGTSAASTGETPVALTLSAGVTWNGGVSPTAAVPPSIQITSPLNASARPINAPISVDIAASAGGSPLVRVELYENNVKIAEDVEAPYSFPYVQGQLGSVQFRALSVDAAGFVGNSAIHTVDFQAPESTGSGFFNGTSSHVEFPAGAGTSLNHFTVEAWVRPEAGGTAFSYSSFSGVPIVARGSSSDRFNFLLALDTNRRPVLAYSRTTSSLISATSVSPLAIGTWYHLAGSYDGGFLRIYVNGEQVAVTPCFELPMTNASQRLAFGTTHSSANSRQGYYRGFIADVRIWDFARSPVAIMSDQQAATFAQPMPQARWMMDENPFEAFESTGSLPSIAGIPTNVQNSIPEPASPGPTPSVILAASTGTPSEGVALSLNATPTVSGGLITRVEFFADGQKVGEKNAAPWDVVFTPTVPGEIRFIAVATTDLAAKAASNEIVLHAAPAPGAGALFFDGVDDHLVLPATEAMSPENGTVEFWFRRDGMGQRIFPASHLVPIVARGRIASPAEACDYMVGLNVGTGTLVAYGRSFSAEGSTVIPEGTWCHAALTWTSTSMKLYLNGVLEATKEAAPFYPLSASAPVAGGMTRVDGSTSGLFLGALDELRIWSRVRSPEELAAGMSQPIQAGFDLVGRWGFDEVSGDLALDVSGGNHATLRGGVARVAGRPLSLGSLPVVTLTAPADGAVAQGASPNLQAQYSANDADPRMVTFRGRAVAREADDFTIVVLPSLSNYTQSLNGGEPATLDAMMDWIVANRAARNIVFVAQTGDIVDSASANAAAGWMNASTAFARLEDPETTGLPAGIPYGMAAGPLDAIAGSPSIVSTFGPGRFANKAWYAEANPIGAGPNSLQIFTAGGHDFAIAHIAHNAVPADFTNSLNWLNAMLTLHGQRTFIVVLHDLLAADAAQDFTAAGAALKDALAGRLNVALVLGGVSQGEQRRTVLIGPSTPDPAALIHAVSANFSSRAQGGEGWLRMIEFSPARGSMRVRTYSPLLDEFETDSDSDFSLPWWNRLSAPSWAPIATPQSQPPGGIAATWSNLLPGRRYEWTAGVDSALDQVAAPSRRFTVSLTPGSQPPVIALLEPAVPVNASVPGIVYLAADAASAEDTVEHVRFFANGTCIATDTTAPFTYLWQPATEGVFQITAVATDRRGLSSATTPVSVTLSAINPPAQPSVTITQPNYFHEYGSPTIDFTATATVAAPGAIASVRFFINGVAAGTATAFPYTVPLFFPGPGTHQVRAVATTVAGASAISPVFNMSVYPLLSVAPTRGPYLQSAAPTAVTVRWRNFTGANVRGRVRYGLSPDALIWSADESTRLHEHEVRLTGLQPNTRYYYSIGGAGGVPPGGSGEGFSFVTPPPTGRAKKTRIWAFGDSGNGSAAQIATRNGYYTFTGSRGTDILMLLGDNAYNSGTDSEYQAYFFNVYAPLLRGTPAWATIGNHEADGSSSDSTFTYLKVFTLPKAAESGGVPSGTERYYSFDYGNIHFVSLDSMYSSRAANGAMATWLRNDLATTTARWIIAFWHHPPYSKGGWDSDTQAAQMEMRSVFNPILEEYGVDLVLSGHSHNYERSWFMSGHYGLSSTWNAATMRKQAGLGRPGVDGEYVKDTSVSEAFKGTVYVVAGSAAGLYNASLNHPANAVSRNQLGTAVVDVNGNQLDVKFINTTGGVDDWFTIVKPWGTADGDADGLPNDFEAEYGLNPAVFDALSDADGDGMTNRDEFIAGTDPQDSKSFLSSDVTKGAGGTTVRFPSTAGRFYQLLRRGDLQTGEWLPVGPERPGTGAEISITDSSPSAEKGFYRVRVR